MEANNIGVIPANKVIFDKIALIDKLGIAPGPLYPAQEKFLKSNARFKFYRGARRVGKSNTAALDVFPEVLKENTRGWIVGPCVDDKTEILSKRGWLSYKELQVGDLVLTLNKEGLSEWQPCRSIHIQESKGELVRTKMRGHDSLTTINHRWLVGYTGNDNKGGTATKGFRFTTTQEMTKNNEFVLCGAPVMNLPKEKVYSDGFVELVAWYWTEGHNQGVGDGVLITQSMERAHRINNAAREWLGKSVEHMRRQRQTEPLWVAWKMMKPSPSNLPTKEFRCGIIRFNSIAGKEIKAVAPDKVVSPDFINKLTQEQLELFIQVSVMADGHERVRTKESGKECRERVVVQDRQDRLSSLQMVTQLAGLQSTLLYDKSGERYVLNIVNRKKIWLGQTKQQERKSVEYYEGNIWCPVTPNQTWLARREGTVYFTGNTFSLAEKEFRYILEYVRQYIKILDLREKDFIIHDNKKQGDLYIKTPWGSEVFGMSAKDQTSLVGEALDWIIVAESAQHREDTWLKYLLPTLSTRKGRAIFPSTPDTAGEWLYELEEESSNWKDWEVFHCAQWDVPHISQDEIDMQRRQMGDNEYYEQVGGEWRFYKGRVYSSFARNTHIIKDFEVPTSWPVYAGLDFGHEDHTAMIYVAKSPEGDYYVFKLYYKNRLATPEHCNNILNIETQFHNPIVSRVADYHALGKQLMRDWELNGIKTKPCVNDVKGKRDRLMALMEIKEERHPYHARENGEPRKAQPRIFIMESCKEIIKELMWFQWKGGRADEGSKGAVVGADHAINALEYAMMEATTKEYKRFRQDLDVYKKSNWATFL